MYLVPFPRVVPGGLVMAAGRSQASRSDVGPVSGRDGLMMWVPASQCLALMLVLYLAGCEVGS